MRKIQISFGKLITKSISENSAIYAKTTVYEIKMASNARYRTEIGEESE